MSDSGTSTADDQADDEPAHDAEDQPDDRDQSGNQEQSGEQDQEAGPEPSWWHSSHPTFAGLVGFFTGVAYVIVIPGIYAALLSLVLSDSSAQRLFPLVGVALLVPLALLIPRKTRRFAQFMLLGVVSTVVVVGVTTAVVLFVMIKLVG